LQKIIQGQQILGRKWPKAASKVPHYRKALKLDKELSSRTKTFSLITAQYKVFKIKLN